MQIMNDSGERRWEERRVDTTVCRLFMHVVESKSLAEAAEQLHLSQPTVSRQLQQLEAELGTRLFNRDGRTLQLNEAGERVYQHAASLLAQEQQLKDELGSLRDPARGIVHIGAGLTPSIYLLPAFFASYRRMYPGVEFSVRTGSSEEIVELLHRRTVALGVVTTVPDNTEGYVCTPLFTDPLRLVVRPDDPLAVQNAIPFRQLADIPLILLHERSGLRRLIDSVAIQHAVELHPVMETDNLESMNRLVQAGIGAAFLPESAVYEDVRSGRLRTVEIADVSLGSRTISLLHPSGAVAAAPAQFAAYLHRQTRRAE